MTLRGLCIGSLSCSAPNTRRGTQLLERHPETAACQSPAKDGLRSIWSRVESLSPPLRHVLLRQYLHEGLKTLLAKDQVPVKKATA